MECIQIEKGELFSLNKIDCIKRVLICLNWKSDVDIDMSAFLVGEDGLIQNNADFVYYNSETRACTTTREKVSFDRTYSNKRTWKASTIPISADGSVILLIDDNFGYEGCYEIMHVDLSKVCPNIKEIIFCASLYNGDNGDYKTFGNIGNLSITLSNEESDEKLCCYRVEENFSTETAIEVAKLFRNENNEWKFETVGEGHNGGLQTLIDIYA